MSIDNNNPELTKFLNPYYLEQNEAQNYYNSLDSSTSLSRSKTHNNNGLDSGPGPGPGQIAYLPAHEKEARFLAQEEEQYSHRIGVNGVLMGRLHQHGGGDFDHNRGGEEYIDLPQASQKIPQTRTLPLRTKTTLFNQVYRVSGGGDSTDAQNNDGGVMVGGNTKKSNIQPVNHFRDLSTNITTTADGTFVAGPPAATVVIAAGSSGAIAPKGGKQSVPVGIGMSVNDSVYSGTGGHTRKGPGKGGAADVHKNSQQQQGVTHSHKKGKNIDGSDSLFNENFDHGGSVVSALTMISQHEDHDGLQ